MSLTLTAQDKRRLLAEALRRRAAKARRDFPLSLGQQALWYLYQLRPEDPSYNALFAVRLRSRFDRATLRQAFQQLLERHPSLRTLYGTPPGGGPVRQRPKSEATVAFHEHTVSAGSSGEELHERTRTAAYRPFDLETGPVFRVDLFSVAEDDAVLLFTAHHIGIDFWSFGLMLEDLLALYAGRQPAPAGAPYSDFVHYQRQLLDSPEGERLWAYWSEQLAAPRPVLDLPTDRPRPAVQSHDGDTLPIQLDAELTAAARRTAKHCGATANALLLALYATLLHRYSGQRDLLLGSPMAGRTKPEFERTVGLFVNLVVLRCGLERDADGREPSFEEVVRRTQRTLLGALEHQEAPFAWLVEKLGVTRDPSRSPLVDAAFALESGRMDRQGISALMLGAPGARAELAGLTMESMSMAQQEGQFDLTFHLMEMGEYIAGVVNYSRDLFDRPTIERMAGHFAQLLASACAEPSTRIGDLELLTDSERHSVLSDWNQTDTEFDAGLAAHQAFEAQARRQPAAAAVRDPWRALTYGQLNAEANRLARYLQRAGVGLESRVGIFLERSCDLVTAVLAVVKAGGAYVPMDPDSPAGRVAMMAEDGGFAAVITRDRLCSTLPELDCALISLEAAEPEVKALPTEDLSAAERGFTFDPENLVYVIFTSGSTGRPKGTELRHRGLRNLVSWHCRRYATAPGEVSTMLAGPAFDASVWELWPCLSGGAELVVPPAEIITVPRQLTAWLAEAGITISFLPTPLAEAVLMRHVSGEPLPAELRLRVLLTGGDRLHRLNTDHLPFDLVNHYGPTEGTVVSTAGVVDLAALAPPTSDRPASALPDIGGPIDNTRAYILDPRRQPSPVGVPGELWIGGVSLARGYLGRPALTAESFVPDPFASQLGARCYRTGDLVQWLPSGRIAFVGRLDHQVKIRGFRIELGEIEALLDDQPEVAEAAVLVRSEGARQAQQLVAYLALTETALEDVEVRLRRVLGETLPSYMVPTHFIVLEHLPLNTSGKIDRLALEQLPLPQKATEAEAEAESTIATPAGGLAQLIAGVWSEVLGIEAGEIAPHHNFFDLGGNSLLLAEVHDRLAVRLEARPERAPSVVELLQYPTLHSLAELLVPTVAEADTRGGPGATVEVAAAQRAADPAEPIAIVGMAGRFPGAASVDEFWRNLRDGVESISFFSPDEVEVGGLLDGDPEHPDFVAAGGVLDDIESFDADLFGYNPREAEILDPQQRIFLEQAWAALEAASIDASTYDGRIGVFGGVGASTYWQFNLALNPEVMRSVGGFQVLVGNDKDFLPSRVAYKLGLTGPAVNVQTACSTSLVAVHMACESLRRGECEVALAGGASVRVPHKAGYVYAPGMILSRDGHCRAFDADASGTVGGNGVAMVVLKPLSRALDDGDHIHALIRSSAINNDGAHKLGYTAPSVEGQAKVIRTALAAADIEPSSIGYVEAHGTGTELGDPIEVEALNQAWRGAVSGDLPAGQCALGAVKTNIGHLDAAAGVAGLIKAALAIEHGELPPSLNFETPNPKIDFAATPFYVNTKLSDWNGHGSLRRAAVSSFGIGGTNAHAILEQAPGTTTTPTLGRADVRPARLLVLSAQQPAALQAVQSRLVDWLESHPEADLGDVAFTLQTGRWPLEHRRALVVRDRGDALAVLRGEGEAGERLLAGRAAGGGQGVRPVAFLFPGQGSQHVDMGRELYDLEPVFRETVDACATYLEPQLGLDLRSLLYPDLHPSAGPREAAAERLRDTRFTQPALFTIELAWARLWQSWGIQPVAMLGHSIGEYVAAHLAGVFDLEAALALVAARGSLMADCEPGSMLSVELPEAELRARLQTAPDLDLATLNAPELCVVSGPVPAVEAFAEALAADGVEQRRLHTSHAFHSRSMEPAVEAFRARVAEVDLRAPQRPFVSNLSGVWITAEQAMDPDYWARHLREAVRFGDGVATLLADTDSVLLEVGPGKTLSSLARRAVGPQAPAGAGQVKAIASARHPRDSGHEEGADVLPQLDALARLWLAGVKVDWACLYGRRDGARAPSRVRLPVYPFQRQRHWIEPTLRLLKVGAQGDTASSVTGDMAASTVGVATAGPAETASAATAGRNNRPELPTVYAEPRDAIETELVELWQELLGVDPIGVHDDFLDLGGHSLLGTRMLSRVRDRFGVELPLGSLLRKPTVASLASLVVAGLPEGAQSTATASPEFQAEALPAAASQQAELESTTAPVEESLRAELADWFYRPAWQLDPRPIPEWPTSELQGMAGVDWLIFVDDGGLGEALTASLRRDGQRVTTVHAGAGFRRLGDVAFEVAPEVAEDHRRLLRELSAAGRRPRRVVHLWSLDAPTVSTGESPEEEAQLERAMQRTFFAPLHLLQALEEMQDRPLRDDPGSGDPIQPLELHFLVSGLHRLQSVDPVRPEQALLLGPARVAPVENPRLSCRVVDLDAARDWTDDPALDRLLAEFSLPAKPGASELVALRGEERWRESFEQLHLDVPTATRLPLRPGGSYLIIGGTGGIGYTLARHLAEHYQARLVLTGRTELGPAVDWRRRHDDPATPSNLRRKLARVLALQDLGAEVEAVVADVTDFAQMRDVLTHLHEYSGRLDGVVHAAGVAGGGTLQRKLDAEARSVLAPKVAGTLVLSRLLDELLRETPKAEIDEPTAELERPFLLLCSSLAGSLGIFGQGDYASANAFQDAWAEAHGDDSVRPQVLALAWDSWRERGMAAEPDMPPDLRQAQQRLLADAITPAEGPEVFERALAAGESRLLVATVDLHERSRQLRMLQPDGAPPNTEVDTPNAETTEAEMSRAETTQITSAERTDVSAPAAMIPTTSTSTQPELALGETSEAVELMLEVGDLADAQVDLLLASLLDAGEASA